MPNTALPASRIPALEVACSCGRLVRLTSKLAGKAVDCPTCGQTLTLPAMGVLAEAAPARPPQLSPRPRPAAGKAKPRVGRGPLLGAAVALLAIAVGGWAYWQSTGRTTTPDTPQQQENAEPAAAKEPQGPALLLWKLESGTPIFVEMATAGTKSTTTQGKTTSEEWKQTFYFRWLPERQHDGGVYLQMTLQGCKVELRSGIHAVAFDTTRRTDHPLTEVLVGAEFQATLDSGLKVKSLSGSRRLLNKLHVAEAALQAVFETAFNEQAVTQVLDGFFAALPGREVKPGESWGRHTESPALLGGHFQARYNYTYQGKRKGLERIQVDTAQSFHYPEADPDAAVRVLKASLKPTQSGVLWFDAAAGRITSGEMTFRLRGDIEMSVAGEKAAIEMESTKKTTVRVSGESFVR